MISVTVFKMGKHSDFRLSFFQTEATGFYSCHKTDENF